MTECKGVNEGVVYTCFRVCFGTRLQLVVKAGKQLLGRNVWPKSERSNHTCRMQTQTHPVPPTNLAFG